MEWEGMDMEMECNGKDVVQEVVYLAAWVARLGSWLAGKIDR